MLVRELSDGNSGNSGNVGSVIGTGIACPILGLDGEEMT